MDTSLSYVDRQFPHGLIEQPNPLFELERRRLGRLHSFDAIKNYSVNRLLYPLLIGLVGCMCLQERGGIGAVLFGIGGPFITVGLLLASDMYYTMVTINSINHYITSGQWDVVKITLVKDQTMLDAIYAVAQIRAWRMMMYDVAMRLCGVLVIFFLAISAIMRNGLYLGKLNLDAVFAIIIFLVVAGIWVGLYVVEPLWRMRALTAVGLALSARITNLTFTAIAGFGITFALHIAQIVMLIGVLLLAAQTNRGYSSSAVAVEFAALFFTVVIAGMVFILYKTVQVLSLSDALNRAFRPE
jgi:hypothetical protein